MLLEKIEYSIVIPVCNEEENISKLYEKISTVMQRELKSYEILFVNDGSIDNTSEVLVSLNKHDPRLRAVIFSKNFGRQMALTAGVDYARGDAVIMMDGDLQHPPEIIPELIRKHKEGYDIVYTTRTYLKNAGIFKRISSKLFYRTMSFLGVDLNPGGTEFMLIDKVIIDCLKQARERFRFLRGIINWVGFKKIGVPYVAAKRYSGKTKFSAYKMIEEAFVCIFSFSSLPLYLAGYLGLIVSGVSFLYVIYALYVKLVKGIAIPGWTSVVMSVLLIGGVQLIFLGILGAYVGRIYEEIKGRPLYIVKQKIGTE